MQSRSEGSAATAAEEREERGDAAQHPPASPLIEEVSPGHPMREAFETAEAERQAGGFGRLGRALNRRSRRRHPR